MTQAVKLAQLGSPGISTGFKNRIINGAMVIDQRNAGASVSTPTAGNWTYFLDRWAYFGTSSGKYSVQQNAGSVTPPAGFTNYLGVTSLAATTVGSGDVYDIKQAIEGLNCADLGWGTANAKTVTLSFWVRSSLTGSFGGSFSNSDFNRLYPFSYTISSANTWEQKTITVAGDTSGSWLTTNGIGINVVFGLGVGTSFQSTANVWGSSGIVPTGSTSVVSTNGATWYITGVQFEVGTTATDFEYRDYGRELMMCQRYFEKNLNTDVKPQDGITCGVNGTYAGGGLTAYNTTNGRTATFVFQVAKRAAPTLTFYRTDLTATNGQWGYWNGSGWASSSAISTVDGGQNSYGFSGQVSGSYSANTPYLVAGVWTASAEL